MPAITVVVDAGWSIDYKVNMDWKRPPDVIGPRCACARVTRHTFPDYLHDRTLVNGVVNGVGGFKQGCCNLFRGKN